MFNLNIAYNKNGALGFNSIRRLGMCLNASQCDSCLNAHLSQKTALNHLQTICSPSTRSGLILSDQSHTSEYTSPVCMRMKVQHQCGNGKESHFLLRFIKSRNISSDFFMSKDIVTHWVEYWANKRSFPAPVSAGASGAFSILTTQRYAMLHQWMKYLFNQSRGSFNFCLVSDNPEVDILGANLYNMYLRRYRRLSGGREISAPEQGQLDKKAAVATSRTVPPDAAFLPQTARTVECEYFIKSNSILFHDPTQS